MDSGQKAFCLKNRDKAYRSKRYSRCPHRMRPLHSSQLPVLRLPGAVCLTEGIRFCLAVNPASASGLSCPFRTGTPAKASWSEVVMAESWAKLWKGKRSSPVRAGECRDHSCGRGQGVSGSPRSGLLVLAMFDPACCTRLLPFALWEASCLLSLPPLLTPPGGVTYRGWLLSWRIREPPTFWAHRPLRATGGELGTALRLREGSRRGCARLSQNSARRQRCCWKPFSPLGWFTAGDYYS